MENNILNIELIKNTDLDLIYLFMDNRAIDLASH